MRTCFFLSFFILTTRLLSQSSKTIIIDTTTIFRWIDNPVHLEFDNNCEVLIAKADKGIFTGQNCDYLLTIGDLTTMKVKITVGNKNKTKIRWTDSIIVSVKPLPDPWILFALSDENDTFLSRAQILNTPTLSAPIEFAFRRMDDYKKQKIIAFTLRIERKDSTIFMENQNDLTGRYYTDTIFDRDQSGHLLSFEISKRAISKSALKFIDINGMDGDLIYIENMMAVLYEVETRKLKPLKFIFTN